MAAETVDTGKHMYIAHIVKAQSICTQRGDELGVAHPYQADMLHTFPLATHGLADGPAIPNKMYSLSTLPQLEAILDLGSYHSVKPLAIQVCPALHHGSLYSLDHSWNNKLSRLLFFL